MTPSLQHELRQTKPFPSLQAEAALSVARTAALLDTELTEVLRPHGLTPTQYNVLRILRGAGNPGLCRYEVAERLVTPGPDVTRLLDRLEASGLVGRARDPEDRRQVKARITNEGLTLLDALDDTLAQLHQQQFAHLKQDQLQTLVRLLADARERA